MKDPSLTVAARFATLSVVRRRVYPAFLRRSDVRLLATCDEDMAKKKAGGYYAVHRGHTPGVYPQWEDKENPANTETAKFQTDGFHGAIHQKFSTLQEAQHFVANGRNGGGASGGGSGAQRRPTSTGAARANAAPYPTRSTSAASTTTSGSATDPANMSELDNADETPHPMGEPRLIAWCDGSCLNNGRTDVPVLAGSGIHWEQVPGGPQVPAYVRLP